MQLFRWPALSPLVHFAILFTTKTLVKTPTELEKRSAIVHEKCVKEPGVDPKMVSKVREYGVLIDDSKLKCYLKCALIEFEVLKDGRLYWDVIVRLQPSDRKKWAIEVKAACGHIVVPEKGEDLCNFAYRAHKCAYDFSPADYYLV